MRWTPEEYQAYLKRQKTAPKSVQERLEGGTWYEIPPDNKTHYKSNHEDHCLSSGADPKRTSKYKFLGSIQGAEGYPARFHVRITSFRCQLGDADSLCGKYFVDALRYSGIIRDDTTSLLDYSIRQEKVKTRKEEKTEIEITPCH